MASSNVYEAPQGYDFSFVSTLPKEHECPICHLGLKYPVQTDCGHRFCRECLAEAMRRFGPKCPLDNINLSDSDIFNDKATARQVLSLQVKCPCNGCDWIGELGNVEDHRNRCDYQLINCPFENCDVYIERGRLAEHFEKLCLSRIVVCRLCGEDHPFCKQEEHSNTCKHLVVVCPHCNKTFPRDKKSVEDQEKMTREKLKLETKIVKLETELQKNQQELADKENVGRQTQMELKTRIATLENQRVDQEMTLKHTIEQRQERYVNDQREIQKLRNEILVLKEKVEKADEVAKQTQKTAGKDKENQKKTEIGATRLGPSYRQRPGIFGSENDESYSRYLARRTKSRGCVISEDTASPHQQEATTYRVPNPLTKPFAPSSPDDIKLGMRVLVTRTGNKIGRGVVRYIGNLPGRTGTYLGVELDTNERCSFTDGKNDGSVDGQRFFMCEPHRGIFVSFDKVMMCYS